MAVSSRQSNPGAISSSNSQLSELKIWLEPNFPESQIPPLDIFVAASIGCLAVLRTYISENRNINAQNKYGWTPLMYAAYLGHHTTVKILLDAGADVNVRNSRGYNALICASLCGNDSIAKTLLSRGGGQSAHLNATDKNGWTPLFHATSCSHHNVVKLLLSFGADVNVIDRRTGFTPLMLAAYEGHQIIVQEFLSECPDKIDFSLKSRRGENLRVIAATQGFMQIVSLLDNFFLTSSVFTLNEDRKSDNFNFVENEDNEIQAILASRRHSKQQGDSKMVRADEPSVLDGPSALESLIAQTKAADISSQMPRDNKSPNLPRDQHLRTKVDNMSPHQPHHHHQQQSRPPYKEVFFPTAGNNINDVINIFPGKCRDGTSPINSDDVASVTTCSSASEPTTSTTNSIADGDDSSGIAEVDGISSDNDVSTIDNNRAYGGTNSTNVTLIANSHANTTNTTLTEEVEGIADDHNITNGIPKPIVIYRQGNSDESNDTGFDTDTMKSVPCSDPKVIPCHAQCIHANVRLTPQNLSQVLQELGLTKYLKIFDEQDVDLPVFLTLTDDDLRQIGITLFGPRRKMTTYISRYHSRSWLSCSRHLLFHSDYVLNMYAGLLKKQEELYKQIERLEASLSQEQRSRTVVESTLSVQHKTTSVLQGILREISQLIHESNQSMDTMKKCQDEFEIRLVDNGGQRGKADGVEKDATNDKNISEISVDTFEKTVKVVKNNEILALFNEQLENMKQINMKVLTSVKNVLHVSPGSSLE